MILLVGNKSLAKAIELAGQDVFNPNDVYTVVDELFSFQLTPERSNLDRARVGDRQLLQSANWPRHLAVPRSFSSFSGPI